MEKTPIHTFITHSHSLIKDSDTYNYTHIDTLTIERKTKAQHTHYYNNPRETHSLPYSLTQKHSFIHS